MKKRWLILVLVALLVMVIAKKAKSHRESQWHGLTESQVRSKLDAKLPSRIPDDKRSMISDKIVGKMRARGVISDDPDATADSSTVSLGPTDGLADKTIDMRDIADDPAELAQK